MKADYSNPYWTNERLMAEYLDLAKHSFNRLFGHNARQAQNECADELERRGITEIPNIFGPLKVTWHTY